MEKKKKTQQRNETFMLRGCILGLKLAVGKKRRAEVLLL